jgi:hypothetical protein
MRDRWLIAAWLLILLALVSFPSWYGLASGGKPDAPALSVPRAATDCVAPVAYMKSSHMKLLYEWRDQAVRRGDRVYTAHDGRKYEISLTGTCLRQCHEDKAGFCDRCHAFNGVPGPNCWECHVDPETAAVDPSGGLRAVGEIRHGN